MINRAALALITCDGSNVATGGLPLDGGLHRCRQFEQRIIGGFGATGLGCAQHQKYTRGEGGGQNEAHGWLLIPNGNGFTYRLAYAVPTNDAH